MKINKNEKLNILVAVLFAVLMLVIAYFMKGSEYKQTAMLLLVALWFIPFGYLSKKSKSSRCKEKR